MAATSPAMTAQVCRAKIHCCYWLASVLLILRRPRQARASKDAGPSAAASPFEARFARIHDEAPQLFINIKEARVSAQ